MVAILMIVCLVGIIMIRPAYAGSKGNLTLTVAQTFDAVGKKPTPNDVFTYQLKPDNASFPMPEGSNDQSYTFSLEGTNSLDILFEGFVEPGTYTYTLDNITGPRPDYTSSRTVYSLEIWVTRELDTLLIAYAEDGLKAGSITFDHSYDSGKQTPPSVGSKPKSPIEQSRSGMLNAGTFSGLVPKTGDEFPVMMLFAFLLGVCLIVSRTTWRRWQ